MSNPEKFSLPRFEKRVYEHDLPGAVDELKRMLLDSVLSGKGHADVTPEQAAGAVVCPDLVRMAAALSALMADRKLTFDLDTFRALVISHRYIASLFVAAGMGNADHLIALLLNPPMESEARPKVTGSNLAKLGLLYCGDSNAELSFEQLWNAHPQIAMDTFLGILSHPVQMTEQAEARREQLLTWLPERLRNMKFQPHHMNLLDHVSMFISYASEKRKHDLKAPLNRILVESLEEQGVRQLKPPAKRKLKERPVMLVLLERFGFRHAMYRCYAPVLRALREEFELVGMGFKKEMDEICRNLFDRVLTFSYPVEVPELVDRIKKVKPDINYFPSVGMRQVIIALAALRLAPIQFMTLGHPATTRSPNIDYFITEEGFMGDPECFSETAVLLPDCSVPFEMRRDAVPVEPKERGDGHVVRVAVPAKMMKLNVRFLKVCRRIQERSSKPVEFHFFPGAVGAFHAHVVSAIRRVMPRARVYPITGYNPYIRNLNECDIQLSAFPFGNTNGIVDGARQGLPIVCMDGPEVHSRIDAELLRRLGLPRWLAANNEREYEDIVLRLIHNAEERIALGKSLLEQDLDGMFFDGDASEFAKTVRWIYEHHETIQADGRPVWSVADRRSMLESQASTLIGADG
ncbi:MAG: hypothetical protein ACQESR_19410 [Planctomycetota bacterium]